MRNTRLLAATAALALTLSACDDPNEARVVELEGQLQSAQTEAETMRTQVAELETLRTERDQLRTDLEAANARMVELEATAVGGTTEPAATDGQIQAARDALVETNRQLDQLEQALAAEGFTEVSLDPIRENLQTAVQMVEEIVGGAGAAGTGTTGSAGEGAEVDVITVPTEAEPAEPVEPAQ